jgi:hypothetical protein
MSSKPGQPPGRINLPYPGRNGRIVVNKGQSHPDDHDVAALTSRRCGHPHEVLLPYEER